MTKLPHASCRRSLRTLNLWAASAAVIVAYAASCGGGGFLSPLACAEVLALLAILLLLPIGWIIVAVRDFRGTATRDAAWWAWLIAPGIAGLLLTGPLQDWPLLARLHLFDAQFARTIAAVRAAPKRAEGLPVSLAELEDVRRPGGLRIQHAWATEGGVYLSLVRSPDGEVGVYYADSDPPRPPEFTPEGQVWTHFSRLGGRWWRFDWANP